MLIDSRQLQSGQSFETEICVIGAGIAGITLAMEFDRAGLSCVVLESGGEVRDDATADLYRGPSAGREYAFADGTRSRFLGGSSNCWGGFCRPWDQTAFEQRDWVNASGWPIGRAELEPYYARAHDVLRVPSRDYDPAEWVAAAESAPPARAGCYPVLPRRLPVDPQHVEEIIALFSPPVPLGRRYRPELAASRRIQVLLWANVVDIRSNPWGGAIEQVTARTLSGVDLSVRARIFVLATGGIENARLLLASNRQQTDGLGNHHDLVGRYFQDHPRRRNGIVEFGEAYRHNPLYDVKFHCIADHLRIADTNVCGHLRLPWAVQQREQLLDAQIWFRSMYSGETEPITTALYHLSQRARRRLSPTYGLGRDLSVLMANPFATALYVWGHTTGSRALVRSVTMELIVEPEPDRDSRVTLSDQRDALGMRRAQVDWRLSEGVARTVDRTFELVAAELRERNIAAVTLDRPLAETGWPDNVEGTYHHMGTTRMHDSPRMGVVDRNCRIHGIGNLYVAGSSVFPSSSSNHPTMTLTALALRLADHLVAHSRRNEGECVDVLETEETSEPLASPLRDA